MYRPTMSRNFANVGIALRNRRCGNPSVDFVPLYPRSREEETARESTRAIVPRAIFHVSDTRASDCRWIVFVVSTDR